VRELAIPLYRLQENFLASVKVLIYLYRMPKIPLNPHPLYQVRKALGWTQQDVADKCGVAAITIRKIESRTLKPGRDLLGRIMWATGVDADSLSGSKPTFRGLPYQAELGLAHVAGLKTKKPGGEVDLSEEALQNAFGDFPLVFFKLMASAMHKNALHVVQWAFVEWAADTICEFKLEKHFAEKPDDGTAALWLSRALKSRKASKRKKPTV